MGLVPAGAYNNKIFRQAMVVFGDAIDALLQDILFDPQTSGGLLISVAPDRAESLVSELLGKHIDNAAIIGSVISDPSERIFVE